MSDAHSSRLATLRSQLVDRKLDQILVTDPQNVRYLSGFTGTNGLLVIDGRQASLLTDFRYTEQAASEAPLFKLIDGGSEPRKALLDALAGDVGFDDAQMPYATWKRVSDALPEGTQLVPCGGIVEQLRRVKDDGELVHISAAAAIADRIYERLASDGLAGHTEAEIAWKIEVLAREFGAEGLSFPPIVAAGSHGALPHAQPRDVAIGRGQMVVVDLGCKVAGYCSDATRTFVTGKPSDREREVYEVVLSAQLAALTAVVAGAQASAVDGTAREIITAAGFGECFGHSLGHGVGIDVHEKPTLATRSEDQLQVGEVVTVEPGVYLPGEFGVRIEDLVVVGPTGPQILSSFTKELLEVH
ncbi:MAG: aminopeptidase P family protein [Thermoleophilaceae bacterium]|nr:aminopeptidase P family protein [Thermoleophilaceae bacterium]